MKISIRRNLAATSSNPTLTTMAQELGIMPVLGMVISDEGLRLRPVCRMGKARDKEVWFQHLDDEGKADMREAIRKAWGKWNQLKVTSPLTAEAFRKLRAAFPGLRIMGMHSVSHSRGSARASLQKHDWSLLAARKLPTTLGPMPPASSCVAFYATLAFACQTGWDLELWDAQSATCRPKASPVSLCCACQGSIHRPARNKAILCGQTAADLAVAIGRASNRAKAEMAYITGVLHMVRSKDNRYCGKALEILQDRIIVRQTAAISAVEAVDLPRERRSQPQTPPLPTQAQPVLRHAWPGARGC